ncbi:PepSY domain-containing protein [Bacillus solimangrovi]|uniref:Peptidase M4 n=1 Tax=Bacillus solimangrovi TaxID=1305675 RepID=A0A1E5LCH3_9BACI|nr:PepSY domain-containing protein [Bacillus solimangrovi]OEH91776.1 peptidase M4 [Bacillus solimangrovi]
MNWKNTLLGVSIGAAAGVWAYSQSKKPLSAEQALRSAKEALKENGPVDGSWIHMAPESIKKNGLTYSVYRGGISRLVEDDLKQEEFLVDANTGTIVDVL